MESHEYIKRRNHFLEEIVPYVQIEKDDFIERVAKRECYEWTIYKWIMRLFDKGISADEAITIIHRTRRIVLIHRTRSAFEVYHDITNQNSHNMLSEYPIYKQLTSYQQKQVRNKISAKFNYVAPFESIEQVLQEVKPEIKKKKEAENFGKQKGNTNWIIDRFRQWNLTVFWQKKKGNPNNT